MTCGDPERNIGREHAAGNGGHATGHQRHDFAARHGREIGSDDQWRFGLAHEDVGSRSEALTAAGAHEALHHPRCAAHY